jgi:AcrR family transcriptional regulator
MPRTPDQHLQERILKAAERLWRTRGEKGLTLRGVARHAGTTTTTVYKRFRNRDALRYALAGRAYEQLIASTTLGKGLEEANRKYLDFAEDRPHEYMLVHGPAWPVIFGPGRSRPLQSWTMTKLAERFGGAPKDYVDANFVLFLASHGAASLLTAAPKGKARSAARKSCDAVLNTLIQNIEVFRRKARR